ncbi:MAG: GTPase [Gammaproteobacteria bacterium]
MLGDARIRVVILGAAGRDFHDFNMLYRDDPSVEVVAFTAAQIPGIAGRRYPPALAGALYPQGIPILAEEELAALVVRERVRQVVFAYSDVSYAHVMRLASVAIAAGADFVLPGPERTWLKAGVPVIAVSAVRTGCGKSQTARWLSRALRAAGLRVAVIRHPMPYGDLERQAVQRFATRADLDAARCTVEEREEYEPHIATGSVVHAGVDYAPIVAAATREADLIVWDGGNNDFPFVRPDLHLVLVDPLRPGDEDSHHPGAAVLRMADIVVVAKCNSASDTDIARVERAARAANPLAAIVRAGSRVTLDDPAAVRGRRVLVVEDGPSLTHGGLPHGAGFVAARVAGAAAILDPRPCAAALIAEVFERHPHIGAVLPAVGYGPAQLQALAQTIRASDAEIVISATPADLAALVPIDRPVVRARYDFQEMRTGDLLGRVADFVRGAGLRFNA